MTEHQFPTVTCPHCHAAVRAPRPLEVPPGAFGPRVAALVALVHGRYRLRDRETAALVEDWAGLPIRLGSVPALCATVSAALAPAYAPAQTMVQAQAVANVAETSWNEAGARRWLWVAVSAICTVLRVAPHRSAAALVALRGAGCGGSGGADRYGAYNSLPAERWQLCWAQANHNWR